METEKKRTWTPSQETAMRLRDKLLLVSAAAGSGKTSVLTERIIRRLLDSEDPVSLSDLLIVTFTRAAAAELKTRIAAALGEALAADPSNMRLSNQLLLLGSAQISTIDAYFQQAVRANFERLGLPASFRMADEGELFALSQEIMNDLLAEFYGMYEPPIDPASGENPFSRLRNNRFADCMDHIYSGTSSGDLAEILLRFYDRFGSYPQGIDLLRDAAEQLRAEADGDFLLSRAGGVIRERLFAEVSSFAQVLAEVKSRHSADPEAAKKQGGILADDAEQCQCLLRALGGKEWEEVRRAAVNFVFPRFVAAAKPAPEWSERYQSARNNFKKRLAALQSSVFAASPLQLREEMLQTAAFAEMLHRFYGAFRDRFLAEKLDRGILGFNDIRDSLYRLLTGEDGEAAAQALGGKYREVYIDEYQDVDGVQDRIFSLIGGARRFMVGDIKQSIYGFRGSDPTIFADYRRSMPLSTDAGAETSPSVCVFMSENFRCDQTVIDFANTVCLFLFSACPESVGYLPQDDLQHRKKDPETAGWKPVPAQVVVLERAQTNRSGEADEPAASDGSEREEEPLSREALWIAAEISRLLANGKLNDGSPILPEHIAILTRRSGVYADPYIKALERLGIPVSSDSADRLTHDPLMIDMLNLLRAVDNPYRDLPLSEYLQTERGGFTLAELSAIREIAPMSKSLYDAILVAAQTPDFAYSEKARAFSAWLESYRRIAAAQPADRFLRILYLDERFADLASSPVLLTLYEQARVYQRSSWCGLYGYLDYITRLWDGDQLSAGGFRRAESAVRVITMHASKGLEFPVVFVASCGSAFSSQDLKSPMFYGKKVGFSSNLFHPERGTAAPSVLKEAGKIAVSDENAEGEIRLLYVALTRARERLYVTATPSRQKKSLLSDVSAIHRNRRSEILGGKSFLDWILASLNDAEQTNKSFPAEIRWIAPEEPIEASVRPSETPKAAQNETAVAETVLHFRSVAERAEAFDYPLEALRGVPTKAAASKLRPDLLDTLKEEDDENAIREQIRLMQDAEPSFDGLLSAHRRPTAAEIGTATHAFLEFCDLPNLAPDTIDSEMDRLVAQKFLTPETAAIANRTALRKFAASPLIGRIKTAEQILREQKFGLFLPLSELTADPDLALQVKGQNLFVQGSIDLILIGKDGRIELYDYKTDHITPEERADRALLRAHLQARHGNQLACYARAIENLFGKRPDKTYLFLLALGEPMEI